jgi:hypothetical protein
MLEGVGDLSCSELQHKYAFDAILQPYWLLFVSLVVFGVLGSVFSALWWR